MTDHPALPHQENIMTNQRIESQVRKTELLRAINQYRQVPGNGMGGSLHIVLDDYNLRDADVQWCINHATERGDVAGAILGRWLLATTYTQRIAIVKGDQL